MNSKILNSILIISSFISVNGHANNLCKSAHASLVAPIADLKQSPMDQMFLWEQVSNTKRWEKPTEDVEIDVSMTSNDSVQVRALGTAGPIVSFLRRAGGTFWPKHPWNTDETVPHFAGATVERWKARFSASRSMFVYTPEGSLYSVKMPTNDPHNLAKTQPNHRQPTKADLKNSVIISARRSEMIEGVNQRLQTKDSQFDVLLDVVSIADTTTGNGFVVRDLRKLQDGFYYLPAFSVPYAGKQIAAHLGESFGTLWEKNWGALLGRSKAKLLLLYGLQMKTPNAQNMLIQLDKNLRPTGKMLFRDISDSSIVGPVANGLKLGEYVSMDTADGYSIYHELKPNWENSAWQMDEGGVPTTLLNRWGQTHDRTYIETIVSELSATGSGKTLFEGKKVDTIYDLQSLLFSESGQRALSEYRDYNQK